MTPRQETVSETEKPNKGIIAKLIESQETKWRTEFD